MKVSRSLGAFAAILVLASACSSTSDDTTTTIEASVAETVVAIEGSSVPSPEAEPVKQSAASVATNKCRPGKVGFSQPSGDESLQQILLGVRTSAAEDGREVVSTVANNDPTKQKADLNSFLDQGVVALLVDAVAPEAIIQELERAKKEGVVVIINDPATKTPLPVDVILRTRSNEAASAAADYIAVKRPGSSVAVLASPPIPALMERGPAFVAAAEKAGLKVVATEQIPPGNPDASRRVSDSFKQQFGSGLGGLWGFNDFAAIAAASAKSGDFNPLTIGLGATPSGIDAVAAGQLDATVDFNVGVAGRSLYWAAEQVLCGQSLPAEIQIGEAVTVIDSSNVASFRPWNEQVALPFDVTIIKDAAGRDTLSIDASVVLKP
jgi:ribose transport system substrate-binding protein